MKPPRSSSKKGERNLSLSGLTGPSCPDRFARRDARVPAFDRGAILAYIDEERRAAIIDEHGLPQVTANTVTDRERLQMRLEPIRDRGVSFDDVKRIEGLRCVAAPIKTDEAVLGAISVSGPKKRIDDETFRTTLPEIVRNTAHVIEINATHS